MTKQEIDVTAEKQKGRDDWDKLPPYVQGLLQGYCDCMRAEGYVDPPDDLKNTDGRIWGYVEDKITTISDEDWRLMVENRRPGYTTFSETDIQDLIDHLIMLFTVWGYDLAQKPGVLKGHPVYLKKRASVITAALSNTKEFHWLDKKYRLIKRNDKFFITQADDPLWKEEYEATS